MVMQTPVVFLHGYPFDRSMWREQIDFFGGQGYQVIAPELLSTEYDKLQFVEEADRYEFEQQAEACRTMADMARHAASLMDAHSIDQAVICGLSMGGYVAFEFIKLFPDRVRALVLAGTRAPADNEPEKQGRLTQVDEMLAHGMKPIAEASVPKLLSQQTLAEKPEVVARLREMILNADPNIAAAAQRGMAARRDYTGDLGTIDAPTLVIVGRDDPIRPVADAEFMCERIRDSRLEVIENAAHMTNMEQPETFNRLIDHFLKSLSMA